MNEARPAHPAVAPDNVSWDGGEKSASINPDPYEKWNGWIWLTAFLVTIIECIVSCHCRCVVDINVDDIDVVVDVLTVDIDVHDDVIFTDVDVDDVDINVDDVDIDVAVATAVFNVFPSLLYCVMWKRY